MLIQLKFYNHEKPAYHIKEIEISELPQASDEAKLIDYLIAEGSNKFQVVVFTPRKTVFNDAK